MPAWDNDPIEQPTPKPAVKPAAKPQAWETAPVVYKPSDVAAPKSGYAMGLRDPVDALAQIAENIMPSGVATKVNKFNNWLADQGVPLARVEESDSGVTKMVRDVNRQYDQQRGEDSGFDWGRLAGNVVNPVTIMAAPSTGGASTVSQLALRGSMAGAVGGALQPVTADDAESNFWGNKGSQAAIGAATGGVATPIVSKVANAAGRVAQSARDTVARRNIDREQIRVAAHNAARANGVNLQDVPQAMREAVEDQVGRALRAGERLDPAAIMRRVEAESVGLVGDAGLTTGQVTRNPMQFTTERNMRGIEISTPQGRGNPIMQRFANQNQALTQRLDDLGAANATEQTQAGQTLMDALRAVDAPRRAEVDALYTSARGMNSGRAAPLERGTFSQMANAELEQGQWGRFLPPQVRELLNDVSSGQTPFDVDAAVQIDSILSAVQRRAGQGSPEASAVGVVRNALQRTPLAQVGLPDGGAGQAARQAFDAARGAARERFATIENTPALRASLDNEAPDNFVRRFLLNADARELQALREQIADNPEAMGQARAQIAAHLRRAAFGENPTGDATFSPNRYMQTLRQLGGQRLGAFFSPDEIQQMSTIGRVASYINSQPAGAAVNNSNTGSAVMDMLSKLTQSPIIRNTPVIRGIANQVGEMQTERQVNQALSGQIPAPPAELSPEMVRAINRLLPLGGAAAGSLGGVAGQ